MAIELNPIVRAWYRDRETERVFEIVALDEDDKTIEIQYFEGEIEELEFDTWYDLNLDTIAAPEDWSGPYDDLVPDDFGDTEEPTHPETWASPLDDIDSDAAFDYGD